MARILYCQNQVRAEHRKPIELIISNVGFQMCWNLDARSEIWRATKYRWTLSGSLHSCASVVISLLFHSEWSISGCATRAVSVALAHCMIRELTANKQKMIDIACAALYWFDVRGKTDRLSLSNSIQSKKTNWIKEETENPHNRKREMWRSKIVHSIFVWTQQPKQHSINANTNVECAVRYTIL